ncbi:MAG: hypothetical protein HUK21_00615 [Fibrobacteraceae bacterium]|nr:hypothetical protein [Fibrobacteraceae bacterium]
MERGFLKRSVMGILGVVVTPVSLLFAQDSANVQLLAELSVVPDTMAADTLTRDSLASDTMAEDAAAVDSAGVNDAVASPAVVDSFAEVPNFSKPLKAVLYLGGGDYSPWYHLGVLYAIEEYKIPIDSVVGTSWGAWIGYLWAKGMPLDDIQVLLRMPELKKYFGEAVEPEPQKFSLPISYTGVPSLRYRFNVKVDSSGWVHTVPRPLEADSVQIAHVLSTLHFQETVYRQSGGFRIPFAVLDCDGSLSKSPQSVLLSLPLNNAEKSGEVCPYLSLPAEDRPLEKSIISVADPIRQKEGKNPWKNQVKKSAFLSLQNQPGVVVRPHTVNENSENLWIQAGFSALESHLGELAEVRAHSLDYSLGKRKALSWFRFEPVYDSIPAEALSSLRTYWSTDDTGFVAPQKFMDEVSGYPAYDSAFVKMLPSGDLSVGAVVKPTFDVAVGGFGSNAFGPLAYAEASLYYVAQMEFDLSLGGFWGGNSYGVSPALKISRIWNKNWNVSLGYNWIKMTPLKSFIKDIDVDNRIYSEERSDVQASVSYQLDSLQNISLNFLFGNRVMELDKSLYKKKYFETYPVSPWLRYEFGKGDKSRFFAQSGFRTALDIGLQSIGLDLGMGEIIPIYWKGRLDAQYSFSPTPNVALTVGATGAVDLFHDEGYGYTYPTKFDYPVLDNCYRQRVEATPWGSEWYNPDLSSHHYLLARASGGFHRNGSGFWIFGAYVRDFEENETALLDQNKFVVEPALRFAYRSLVGYVGISKMVDNSTRDELTKLSQYSYFIRIGNFEFLK